MGRDRELDEAMEHLTLVAGYRLSRRRWYLLLRARYDLGDGEIVRDRRGAIPVFPSPKTARAFAERLFPAVPLTDVEDLKAVAARQHQVQEHFAAERTDEYDLDAGLAWVGEPREPGPDAQDLLAVWSLLGLVGTAPAPDPEHLMGVENFPFAASPLPSSSESELLAFTAWKLRSMVREQRVNASAGKVGRIHGTLEKRVAWNAGDTDRLAAVLDTGISAFGFLVTPKVEAVERELRAALAAPSVPSPRPELRIDLGNPDGRLEVRSAGPWRRAEEAKDSAVDTIATLVRDELASVPTVRQLRRGDRGGEWSDDALARYSRERKEYADDLRAYWNVADALSDVQRRSVPLTLYLRNVGAGRGKGVRVRITFPAGIHVGDADNELLTATRPTGPRADAWRLDATRTPFERRASEIRLNDLLVLPTTRACTLGVMTASQDADGSTVISYDLREIIGRDSWILDRLRVVFPTWRDVRSFTIPCEVSIGGILHARSELSVDVHIVSSI